MGSGTAQITSDDLVLVASKLPDGSFVIMYTGTNSLGPPLVRDSRACYRNPHGPSGCG